MASLEATMFKKAQQLSSKTGVLTQTVSYTN